MECSFVCSCLDIKPEKLETFDEKPENEAKPAGDPNTKNKTPTTPKNALPRTPLKPGQRFFILNGQPLFANYPIHPTYLNQPAFQPHTRFAPNFFSSGFSKVHPLHHQIQLPVTDYFLKNSIAGDLSQKYPQSPNFLPLTQPLDYKQNYDFLSTLQYPLAFSGDHNLPTLKLTEKAEKFQPETNVKHYGLEPIVVTDQTNYEIKNTNIPGLDYFRYNTNAKDTVDDTVVIEAKGQNEKEDAESESNL